MSLRLAIHVLAIRCRTVRTESIAIERNKLLVRDVDGRGINGRIQFKRTRALLCAVGFRGRLIGRPLTEQAVAPKSNVRPGLRIKGFCIPRFWRQLLVVGADRLESVRLQRGQKLMSRVLADKAAAVLLYMTVRNSRLRSSSGLSVSASIFRQAIQLSAWSSGHLGSSK
jgi:hypothetical protein